MGSLLNESSDGDFSSGQLLYIDVTSRLTASLGLLGSLATIAAFLKASALKDSLTGRIATAIALSDLFFSLGIIIGRVGPQEGHTSIICKTQTLFLQFGVEASTFLIACLSFNFFLISYYDMAFEEIRKLDVKHITISFLVALVIALVPLLISHHFYSAAPLRNRQQLWCFFAANSPAFTLITYVPIILVFTVSCISSVWIQRYIKQQVEEDELFRGAKVSSDPQVSSIWLIFGLYVLAFVAYWIPVSLYGIALMTKASENTLYYILAIVITIFPLRGFFNAIIAFSQIRRMELYGRGRAVEHGNKWRRESLTAPSSFTASTSIDHPNVDDRSCWSLLCSCCCCCCYYYCYRKPKKLIIEEDHDIWEDDDDHLSIMEKRGADGEVEIVLPDTASASSRRAFTPLHISRRLSVSSNYTGLVGAVTGIAGVERGGVIDINAIAATDYKDLGFVEKEPIDSSNATMNEDLSTSSLKTFEGEHDPADQKDIKEGQSVVDISQDSVLQLDASELDAVELRRDPVGVQEIVEGMGEDGAEVVGGAKVVVGAKEAVVDDDDDDKATVLNNEELREIDNTGPGDPSRSGKG